MLAKEYSAVLMVLMNGHLYLFILALSLPYEPEVHAKLYRRCPRYVYGQ